MQTIHIAQNGTGEFTSISAALAELTAPAGEVCLFIHKGIYKERLTVQTPRLTLVGESASETIITYDRSALMPSDDIGKLGTFRSYSVLIDTENFTAKNLTFENSAGPGPEAGQALALYVDGDRILFEDCRFLGGQDTLFTGPLPPVEIEKNGFIGPKQYAPRINGRHCYNRCYIEGDIDFIFGSATAYFKDCEFFSKNIGRKINSYVTAASTPQKQPFGYVMEHCRFTGNCPVHSAYLGRPWREYAKTVLIGCYIGEHICPEGWHDWGKTQAHHTVYYAEYASYGPSGQIGRRPDWIVRLSRDQAAAFTSDLVLAGDDGWKPL